MIKSAKLAKEVTLRVVNKIGVLADISRIIADHGLNIEGVAGFASGNEAVLMLVTDDTVRMVEALKKEGYRTVKEQEVLVIELKNKQGALKGLTAKLAQDDIDIMQAYGTTCPEGCPARLILLTSNNEKALVSFKKK
ncbi:MAG: ACT domain-containing protein [Candidatus Omnitrophota bacterium]|jgi:hypothetical protein